MLSAKRSLWLSAVIGVGYEARFFEVDDFGAGRAPFVCGSEGERGDLLDKMTVFDARRSTHPLIPSKEGTALPRYRTAHRGFDPLIPSREGTVLQIGDKSAG